MAKALKWSGVHAQSAKLICPKAKRCLRKPPPYMPHISTQKCPHATMHDRHHECSQALGKCPSCAPA